MNAAVLPAPLVEGDKCRGKFMILRQIIHFVCFHFASGPRLFVYQLICFEDSYQSWDNPQQPEKDIL